MESRQSVVRGHPAAAWRSSYVAELGFCRSGAARALRAPRRWRSTKVNGPVNGASGPANLLIGKHVLWMDAMDAQFYVPLQAIKLVVVENYALHIIFDLGRAHAAG